MTKLQVMGDRVLVQKIYKETSQGGLHLPSSAISNTKIARVVSVGTGHQLKSGNTVPLPLTEGDKIVFSGMGGTKTTIDGEEYFILRIHEVLGVCDD